eukprot:Transcript_25576.p1 GENE.Transcript_25576~~Transcript_25576.p1  ORF type:complete len:463 (-),score=188.37 Transcript_25576:102-1490(-)
MQALRSRVPAPPVSLIVAATHTTFETHIRAFQDKLVAQRAEVEEASRHARSAQSHAALAIHRRQCGDAEGAAAAFANAVQSLGEALPLRTEHEQDSGSLSAAAQQVVAAEAFESFLASGTLGPRKAGTCSDEEWLAGLVLAAHEIGRYAGVAATSGDALSVRAGAAVVCALHEELAQFDLRNGSLRRSFDSLKYVVRRLEDILYELSLFPPTGDSEAANPAAESQTSSVEPGEASLLDRASMEAARTEYAALDAAREQVIKKCREPQKMSKQAIFALQRGDARAAEQQLQAALRLARAVLEEEVAAAPSLREQGCVHAMLEELAEASLFQAWLSSSPREILLQSDQRLLGGALTLSEYLGGVCDLVGELGRFAVRRATERDAAGVREALASAVAVQSALLALGGALPRGIHKKTDALKMAVRKLETLLYELSLVERSGRTRAAPEPVAEPEAVAGRGEADGE